MENISLNLANKVKKLEFEMEKRNSIIQLQGKVIKLLDDTKKTIETSLRDQIEEKLLEIEGVEGKVKLIFTDMILFDPGRTRINKKGKELLLKLANSIKENKHQNIVVEGHTDNRPVKGSAKQKYPTNWEISASRAIAVVRFFQEEAGLEPERMSVVGYSFYRPIASNDTEEGRRRNRRIEVILGPPM
ncbi:MAG: OmpA family protein [Deltaproteobacteria bacterium]|nr:OmpA family protein [Deltaproteobacteria bacterium]